MVVVVVVVVVVGIICVHVCVQTSSDGLHVRRSPSAPSPDRLQWKRNIKRTSVVIVSLLYSPSALRSTTSLIMFYQWQHLIQLSEIN